MVRDFYGLNKTSARSYPLFLLILQSCFRQKKTKQFQLAVIKAAKKTEAININISNINKPIKCIFVMIQWIIHVSRKILLILQVKIPNNHLISIYRIE